MNKHILTSSRFLLLFTLTLVTACAQPAVTDSPTQTPGSSPVFTETPTVLPASTTTPTIIPTRTQEPIYPKGTILYEYNESEKNKSLYSINLETQKSELLTEDLNVESQWIREGDVFYATLYSEKTKQQEVFKINSDRKKEQLTHDGVIQIFSIDPNKNYLIY